MARSFPGRALIWILALVPVALALVAAGRSDLASPGAVLNYLGRLTGIFGLALLLLSAALSARVPHFDRHFGGLTKLWHTHHLLGAGALVLLLAHPLLLALAAAEVSLSVAVASLFPPLSNWALWSGWAALALMVAFLAPTFSFFGQPPYERWKRIHRLAGPALILALVHTFQYGRTLPGPVDSVIWPLFALLAVGAVAWRFAFSRLAGRLRYTVEEVTAIGNNLVELSLRPRRRHLSYKAGQFVYLTPYDRDLDNGHGEEHPYTLSSAPDEDRLRIAIKDLGDASRAIQTIQPGSRVEIEGPYGNFFKDQDATRPELWIAGGIGITPFLGRARHLARRIQQGDHKVDIHLVYCVQDEARARFLEELEQLATQIQGLEVHPHYFYREGPLDESFLARRVPDYSDRVAYICGPLPLNHRARDLLNAAGVDKRQIHTEEFELL